MTLRVAILRVDREDETLQNVEGPCVLARVGVPSADADRIAATGLRFTQDLRHGRQQPGHRIGVAGVRRDAGADRHRQALRCVELEALVDERVADMLETGFEGGDGRRRGDDEELVRPVPAEHGRRVELRAQRRDDPLQHVVSGVVAVRLVEEPEVVDVDQGDADRRAVSAGMLERGPELDDECAVVQQPGERIALGRVEQLFGLSADPALRGSEGEVQDRAGDDGCGERDDQHVALDVGDRGEDRPGVAPHADDRPSLARPRPGVGTGRA